tara:strand:- start:48 stop:503 length:456 start_codon:yes stop_codon:yes gene_type:complete
MIIKVRFLTVILLSLVVITNCASNKVRYIEMTDESSEGLLSYMEIDSSNVKDQQRLEKDKVECAIFASTKDISNDTAILGGATLGAAAGASTATGAAAAVAGPIALLSIGITYGLAKIGERNMAATVKANVLKQCLTERGYTVDIKKVGQY